MGGFSPELVVMKKRTLACALFYILLCAGWLGGAGSAMSDPAVSAVPQPILQRYQESDEGERLRLLLTLIQTNHADDAERLLKAYPLQGKYAKNRMLFVAGMIEKSRGDLKGAVAKFRSALASDPSLTLVRSELARALAQLGEYDSAKHHLKLLMAEAKDQAEADNIRSFIDNLDAQRPLKFSAYVSVAPSSNINNGSQVKKVYFNDGSQIVVHDDSRKRSGVGMAAGFGLGYTHDLSHGFSLVAGVGAGAQLYKDHRYNSYGISETLDLRRTAGRGFVALGAVSAQSLMSDRIGLGYYSVGPRISLLQQVTPQDLLYATAVYEWRRYSMNSARNGHAWLVDGSWTHSLSSDANIGLLLGFDNITSGLHYNDYNAYSAGLTFYKELAYGITADVLGEYRYAHFKDKFPLYGVKRRDHRALGRLMLTKRDINLMGYAPSIEYSYIYNHSNVANYKFQSHTVDFRLTKNF